MTINKAPLAVLISENGAWRTTVARELTGRGWRVTEQAGIGMDMLAGADAPAAILIEGRPVMAAGWCHTDWRTGAVAIVVGEKEGVADFPYDARIAAASIGHALARLGVARPLSLPAATHRLREVFGDAAIRPMLNSFAGLLAEAVPALASPDAGPLAHRVAGVAGTLGFASLGRQWRALAEQDDSAADAVRVASRMTIGAIRREIAEVLP